MSVCVYEERLNKYMYSENENSKHSELISYKEFLHKTYANDLYSAKINFADSAEWDAWVQWGQP